MNEQREPMVMMTTPEDAADLAEQAISLYCVACGCQTGKDVEYALEMLISKAARGIELYCGFNPALDALYRTAKSIETKPFTENDA